METEKWCLGSESNPSRFHHCFLNRAQMLPHNNSKNTKAKHVSGKSAGSCLTCPGVLPVTSSSSTSSCRVKTFTEKVCSSFMDSSILQGEGIFSQTADEERRGRSHEGEVEGKPTHRRNGELTEQFPERTSRCLFSPQRFLERPANISTVFHQKTVGATKAPEPGGFKMEFFVCC